MPDPGRLPVRTDPLPGEFWTGYVQRVAAEFGATWADVMSPVLLGQDVGKARWHSGVCVSTASAERLGSYFRLEAGEVAAMHLEAVFGGSALVVDERARAQFDPWPTVSPRVDHLPLTTCGPVRNRDRRVSCPLCCSGTPGLLRLEWQVVWFPACEEHGVLLSQDGGEPVAAEPEVLQAQRTVRARLTANRRNRWFFEHLTALTRSMLGVGHRGSLIRRSPAEVAEVLPVAVRGVQAEGFPRSQGLVGCSVVAGRLRQQSIGAAQLLRPPTSLRRSRGRRVQRPVEMLPRRLPRSLFAGTISDLLDDAAESVISSRSVPEQVAAVTVAMVVTGQDAQSTVEGLFEVGPRISRGMAEDVLVALAEVERHGRLEGYWAAIRSAAQVVEREGVDYRERRVLLDSSYFTWRVLRAEVAPPMVVWTWLAHEWAGEALPNHAPAEVFLATLGRSTLTAATPRLSRQLLALTDDATALVG